MKTSINHLASRLTLFVAFASMLALVPANAIAQTMGDIQWLSDVEQAKKIAAKENKLVLLHFDASWCRPCKALETYVFRANAVKKSIAENVVPVKLDADRELELVNAYDVSMVPFDVIITPGGRIITERRSPSDAENYAKMISGTSTASRMLKKEKLGPIAHQRELVKNRTLAGQDPMEFRAEGPKVEEFGLSKDASQLKRRQDAFSPENKSVKKSNPFVVSDPEAEQGLLASVDDNSLSAQKDTERNEFVARERNWVAPTAETRRAKPERIINERYFESIAKKTPAQQSTQLASNKQTDPGPFSLASSTQQVTENAVELDDSYNLSLDGDNSVAAANISQPEPIAQDHSVFGDFKPAANSQANAVIEVSEESEDLLDTEDEPLTLDRNKFGLKGKCPVTLITEGRWEEGDVRYGIVHRKRTYLFSTSEKLHLFRTDPDKYSPVLAGYDPVVFHEQGKLVDGLVENGVFMGRTPNQKVILFSNAETRAKFQSSPKSYLNTIREATLRAENNRLIR